MGEIIEYKIEGFDELIEKAEKLNGHIPGILKNLLDNCTKSVEAKAKDAVPHDSGVLRASITSLIDPSPLPVWGRVGPSKTYGAYVEFGTKPHWPPIEPLKAWARRHHISPYVLAAKIAKYGTPAQPYMAPSLEKSKDDIAKFVQETGEQIAREME